MRPSAVKIVCLAVVCAIIIAAPIQAQESIDTRIGELMFMHEFVNGYPTDETVQELFDEMDFQRACQTYLWSIPLVSMAYSFDDADASTQHPEQYYELFGNRAIYQDGWKAVTIHANRMPWELDKVVVKLTD